ncbi:amidohydrolase family protein [Alkalicoccobacillus gibsonii]|uniref:amidohydrolase family protein n=1 Tax=Alkalicoccobacillus gibsonii TaxID=79881 RepID=UPI00351208E7
MSIILENAQLVDVEAGVIRRTDISIKDGFIHEIATIIQENSQFTRIDLNGQYVIPGLVDMHVHIKEAFAPFFTASGVTTVRNTGGNVLELRSLIQADRSDPTPRVISADRIIDGPPGLWGETSPWSINVDTVELAKKEVKRQIQAGADFIKVYGLLKKELIQAVIEEAGRHGKEVSADLLHSPSVTALDAAALGVKWFEHVTGVLQAVYPNWTIQSSEEEWENIDWNQPNHENIQNVCDMLLTHDAILCPTLVLYDQQKQFRHKWEPRHEVIKGIYDKGQSLINQWQHIAQYTESLNKMGIQTTHIQAIAKAYSSMGGRVIAGTDTPAGVWTFPGMALHRELELFVEAGFSPIEAIRAATIHAASALKRKDIGAIKVGTVADIVVLKENPLLDIKATQQISFLVKGGKVYTIQELLQAIPNLKEVEKHYEQFIKTFKMMTD